MQQALEYSEILDIPFVFTSNGDNFLFHDKTVSDGMMEREISLDPTSKNMLKVDIIYLDVLKTQSSLSVLHNNKESVVIRLKGYLYKDGKVEKKVTVEESADEVSMSALLIDEGGKFNQQNLSSALKKASVSLVNKLL